MHKCTASPLSSLFSSLFPLSPLPLLPLLSPLSSSSFSLPLFILLCLLFLSLSADLFSLSLLFLLSLLSFLSPFSLSFTHLSPLSSPSLSPLLAVGDRLPLQWNTVGEEIIVKEHTLDRGVQGLKEALLWLQIQAPLLVLVPAGLKGKAVQEKKFKKQQKPP